jgi:signal transduction histidine kinase
LAAPESTSRDEALGAIRLADAIDRNRASIEGRWLERVRRDIARTPGVELTQLRDGIPDYLVALVDLLRQLGGEDPGPRSRTMWSDVARGHGITRVRIGFDISQLVHEFVALRQVIREVAAEEEIDRRGPEALLADVLDGAIAAAVQAYVDARDYDARRQQAETVGFVTHELRNPLTSATLAASQLRNSASAEQLAALDTLDRSHRRLRDLIDGVLLSGQLEAGIPAVQPTELRLGEVIEGALEPARAAAEAKGIAFHVRYDPELNLFADPTLTRSAIQNLADNAAKYTDAGHVDIEAERRPDTGELVIHFRDTCQGISAEELRTIFEPFRRGNTRRPGTGLGLAIARRAIESQGGSVHAESPGPSGCHFWITLPSRQ